jgi:RNA polymerase sigma-70 factor (ECF subfamily)
MSVKQGGLGDSAGRIFFALSSKRASNRLYIYGWVSGRAWKRQCSRPQGGYNRVRAMTQEEACRLVSSLFDGWYPSLVRYACRLTGDAALAEDVVQESFMALYRELGAGKTVHNPKAWIFCIVRREIGKHARMYLSREVSFDEMELADTLPGPRSGAPDWALQDDDLAKILACLTRREEEVVLLRMNALRYREIARELGITTSSVSTLLARAVRKLGAVLGAPGAPWPVQEGGRLGKTLQ